MQIVAFYELNSPQEKRPCTAAISLEDSIFFLVEIYFCNCLIMQGVTRNRVLSVFTNLTSWVAFKPKVNIIFLCLDPLSPGS